MRVYKSRIGSALISLLVILLAGGVFGCDDRPSEAAGKDYLLKSVDQETQHLMSLEGFKKTDGQMEEAFGQKGYTMTYEGEMRVIEDCTWNEFDGRLTAMRGIVTDPLLRLATPGAQARAGTVLTMDGTILFEKSEQGWHATHVKISVRTPQKPAEVSSAEPSNIVSGERGQKKKYIVTVISNITSRVPGIIPKAKIEKSGSAPFDAVGIMNQKFFSDFSYPEATYTEGNVQYLAYPHEGILAKSWIVMQGAPMTTEVITFYTTGMNDHGMSFQACDFETDKGCNASSTEAEVMAAYGRVPEKKSGSDVILAYQYSRFVFRNGKLYSLSVTDGDFDPRGS